MINIVIDSPEWFRSLLTQTNPHDCHYIINEKAIFSILITAPIGLIAIQILGPKLLEKAWEEDNSDVSYKNDVGEPRMCELSEYDYGSRRQIDLSQLANIEARLARIEGKVQSSEDVDMITEARRSIFDTSSCVSMIESSKRFDKEIEI